MKKKLYDRMVKRVREVNASPLSFPVQVKRLKPTNLQPNYNAKLKEWVGPKLFDIVATTTAIFEAFKQSEEWKDVGVLSVHDWKCTINSNVDIDTNCVVQRIDTNEVFEIIFKREYIGEFVIGLRPVIRDGY